MDKNIYWVNNHHDFVKKKRFFDNREDCTKDKLRCSHSYINTTRYCKIKIDRIAKKTGYTQKDILTLYCGRYYMNYWKD